MSPRELTSLHIVHVSGAIALVSLLFYAAAGAPETRKRILILSGLAALIVLGTGFRMWQGLYGLALLGWVLVKLVCWAGLAGMTGMLYRRRAQAPILLLVALALAVVAVAMVYLKPF